MAPNTNREPAPGATPDNVRTDHSPWNWLLALPVILPLLTPIFNRENPQLFGFPAFYWLQLAFVLIGVTSTVTVYRMTRRGRSGVGDHG